MKSELTPIVVCSDAGRFSTFCRHVLLFVACCGCCRTLAADEPASDGQRPPDILKISTRSAWIAADARTPIKCLHAMAKNQSGESMNLVALIDRPTVITFFYTRCTNPHKCCSTIGRFVELSKRLKQLELLDQVRLLGITYEPNHDTEEQLTSYAKSSGLETNPSVQLLRLLGEGHKTTVDDLRVPVSYTNGWVNTHGLILYLLDEKGRIAHKYYSVIWDNNDVLADLCDLLHEQKQRSRPVPSALTR